MGRHQASFFPQVPWRILSYHVAGLGVLPSFVGAASEGQGFCPEVFLRDVGAESRPHFQRKAF